MENVDQPLTTEGDWGGFIEYMLKGFFIKAQETHEDLVKITRLLDEIKSRVRTENKKIYSSELIQSIFVYPVITPTKLASELNKHYTTTSKYLAQLNEMGILNEATLGKYHLFANHKLLKILSNNLPSCMPPQPTGSAVG